MSYVLHSSAVAALLLDGSERVRAIVADAPGRGILAPSHIWAQIGETLREKVSAHDMKADEAARLVGVARKLGIFVVKDSELIADAVELAVQTKTHTYDALYAVLAKKHGVPLIIADSKLAKQLDGHVKTESV